MSSLDKINIERLGRTIMSWLDYIFSVSVTDLIAESSIRYPLCGFLERHDHKIKLEEQHPVFPQKHIDFILDKDVKDKIPTYVELKYVRQNSNKQLIFNDLIRLSILKQQNSSCRCLFILCGRYKEMPKKLESIISNINDLINKHQTGKTINNDSQQNAKFYENWLPFNTKDAQGMIIKSNVNVTNDSKIWRSFINDYSTDLNSVHISTQALFISTEVGAIESFVGIWEVF